VVSETCNRLACLIKQITGQEAANEPMWWIDKSPVVPDELGGHSSRKRMAFFLNQDPADQALPWRKSNAASQFNN